MRILAIIVGALLVAIVLEDTFETIVLPRTVTRKLRLTRQFYVFTWAAWRKIARALSDGGGRESFLGAYGPLSLPLLLGLWAFVLVISFGMMQWGLGSRVISDHVAPGFFTDLYMSGTTFFTLGFGDVTPATSAARAVAVLEAGCGLGFLAIVIGYVPVLYQAFSRREVGISLLDARAGSPPTGGEMLRRHGAGRHMDSLTQIMQEWERWAADLLESHLSYPVLVFYRSQHDRQSWLSALTAILDACALLLVGFEGAERDWEARLRWQAQLTFAMARHALIDLSLILFAPPMEEIPERLPRGEWERLRGSLASAGIPLREKDSMTALLALRRQYEPYAFALAERLVLTLPEWNAAPEAADNWQTSAWDHHDHFESGRPTTTTP